MDGIGVVADVLLPLEDLAGGLVIALPVKARPFSGAMVTLSGSSARKASLWAIASSYFSLSMRMPTALDRTVSFIGFRARDRR